ncbi:MAG: protein kinase family protein [Phycisphaeraceae bacterium]|nr:protein kinase family protein [Phycisphaeraceae bacterium]
MTRPLGASRLGDRFLALHEATHSSHVAHRLTSCTSKVDRARVEAAFQSLSDLRHPHLLRIEALVWDSATPWLITPFAGDADGMRTLGRLLRQKGGQMSPLEAGLAVSQLLAAVGHAHSSAPGAPVFHGPLSLDEVLVDRHGKIIIENYGFARRLKGLSRGDLESGREEVVRVVEIAYELVTGLRAEEPIIPAIRLAPRLDRAWSAWLDRGLDPSRGFQTAEQALATMPGMERQGLTVEFPSGARLSGPAPFRV